MQRLRFYGLVSVFVSGCAVPVAETIHISQPQVAADKGLLFIYTANEPAPLTKLRKYEVLLRKVKDGQAVGSLENAGVLSNNSYTYLYVDPGTYAVMPQQANLGRDPLGLGAVACKAAEKCFVRIRQDYRSPQFALNIDQVQNDQGEREILTKTFRRSNKPESSITQPE